jgi:RNA ligase (TIGR02306 family)
MSGKSAGKFPSFIPKTDETRIQSLKGIVEKFEGTDIIIKEKLDGCSVTYFYNNEQFGVCSRNRMVKDDDVNVYWQMAKKYNIEEKMREVGFNVAIQGEIVGSKIQGNKLKLDGIDLFVFDFFNIDKHEYLNNDEFDYHIDIFALQSVPMIDEAFLINDIDMWVKEATIKSQLNKDIWVEGIVIRSKNNIDDDFLKRKMGMNRLSLKVINPEFLLKYDKRN